VSVSVNGIQRVQHGTTSLATSTPGNTAIAVNGSNATAGTTFSSDSGNRAIAVNGSKAFATAFLDFGSGNTARAINGSTASAGLGSNNTATAINGSTASAGLFGSGNTATAINNSNAVASGRGSNNTATAINNSGALAGADGSGNTATAINGSTATAGSGSDNTAMATCGGNASVTGVSGQTATDSGSPPCGWSKDAQIHEKARKLTPGESILRFMAQTVAPIVGVENITVEEARQQREVIRLCELALEKMGPGAARLLRSRFWMGKPVDVQLHRADLFL
jgi:hypothetical protein